MENMLLLPILGNDTRNLYVPTSIAQVVIDSVKHMELLKKFDQSNPILPIYAYQDINYCR